VGSCCRSQSWVDYQRRRLPVDAVDAAAVAVPWHASLVELRFDSVNIK